MPNQFWRLERVRQETGLSRSAVYEGMEASTFPKSFKITERCVAWNSVEVERWKSNKLAAAGRTMEAA